MANIIRPKRSNTASNVPTTGNLSSGELAVNMADQKAYINNGTAVVQIASGKLSGLADVAITSVTSGQVISWNGTTWVNSTSSGSGTVTSVSVVTSAGVSGTVATSTTTPAITLALGAITPTSVAASGAMSGSNLSGTNTGDQTNITGNAATVTTNANLTGDITSVGNSTTLTNAPVIAKVLTGYASGAGTVAATDSILAAIQKLNGNDATNANLTGVVTSVGNATAIADTALSIAKTSGLQAALDAKEVLASKNATGGYAGLTLFKINFKNAANTLTNFFTNATTLARTYTFPDKDITVAGLVDITGTNSGTNTGDQTITLTGGVTGTGTGSFAATVITNANLTGMVTSVGNAASLGSFTSAQLATALSDETGTGATVFATSPTLITPALGTPTALVGTNITGTAASLTAGITNALKSATTTVDVSAAAAPTTGQVLTATGASTATWQTAASSGGTVTSVAELTLGTTGTDLSSTVANGTTTPVITLQVPTASASNRGALSSADWNTFNNKTNNTGTVTSVGGAGTVVGLTLTGTVTTSGSLTLGGTFALPTGQVPSKNIYDEFTATASQTTFTTSATYTSGKIDVFCNGVRMAGADVTVTNGTSVVFVVGIAAGSLVNLVYPI